MKKFGLHTILFFIFIFQSCTFKSYNLSRNLTYDDDLYSVDEVSGDNLGGFDDRDHNLVRDRNRLVAVNSWNIGQPDWGFNSYNFHLPYYYNWSFGLDNYWDPFLFRYRNGIFFFNNPWGWNYYMNYPFYNPYWAGNFWNRNWVWNGYNRYSYYSWYCSNPLNYRFRALPRTSYSGFTSAPTSRPVVGNNVGGPGRYRANNFRSRNSQNSSVSNSTRDHRTYTPSTPRTYTPRTYTPSTPRSYHPPKSTPTLKTRE